MCTQIGDMEYGPVANADDKQLPDGSSDVNTEEVAIKQSASALIRMSILAILCIAVIALYVIGMCHAAYIIATTIPDGTILVMAASVALLAGSLFAYAMYTLNQKSGWNYGHVAAAICYRIAFLGAITVGFASDILILARADPKDDSDGVIYDVSGVAIPFFFGYLVPLALMFACGFGICILPTNWI